LFRLDEPVGIEATMSARLGLAGSTQRKNSCGVRMLLFAWRGVKLRMWTGFAGSVGLRARNHGNYVLVMCHPTYILIKFKKTGDQAPILLLRKPFELTQRPVSRASNATCGR
jgi:hypothetical protein